MKLVLNRVAWMATFLALGAVLVLLGMGCAPHLDGDQPTIEKPLGGNILNTKASVEDVKIYKSWGRDGATPDGRATILGPNERSDGDADGYCIPDGYTATVRVFTIGVLGWTTHTQTGCHKITDNQSAEITVLG